MNALEPPRRATLHLNWLNTPLTHDKEIDFSLRIARISLPPEGLVLAKRGGKFLRHKLLRKRPVVSRSRKTSSAGRPHMA